MADTPIEERIAGMDNDIPVEQFLERLTHRYIPQSMSKEANALVNENWKRLISELRAALAEAARWKDSWGDEHMLWGVQRNRTEAAEAAVARLREALEGLAIAFAGARPDIAHLLGPAETAAYDKAREALAPKEPM